MSGPLGRAAAFLLVAPEASGRSAVAAVPAAARAVVLGTPQDAPPLAAAVALTLRARGSAGLVAVWRTEGAAAAARGASVPSAVRLAARLSRRRLAATARGRLAWLPLDADPESASGAVRRAAAVVDGPLVTALAGPRPPALEALIEEHDLAIVAADPATPLARTALAALSTRCVSAVACAPLPRGPARALALAGLSAPRLPITAVHETPDLRSHP
jgi:hypothetical protein